MKTPVIKDIRTFLTLARLNGYYFFNNYCAKTIVYDPLDCIIQIQINLFTGEIDFKSYVNNVSCELEMEDKRYLLKDIDYLVKWIDVQQIEEEYGNQRQNSKQIILANKNK